MRRRLIILGSTGSIGVQAIKVVEHLNTLHERGLSHDDYRVVGLAAGGNLDLLDQQRRQLDVRDVATAQDQRLDWDGVEARTGPDAAERLVREIECDVVISAAVGSAGLPATLAAVELGRDVALANKETLVAAGSLVTATARRTGARLLPVDSEHAALWQCLLPAFAHTGSDATNTTHPVPPMETPASVARIILTASGGPFRTWSREQTANATVEQALNHPTWSMGAKITIDSATLMNKALEVIEAHWLFGLENERIGVVVHPQSIVHCLAEYVDGSVIAQLGAPDMRGPIQHALTWPNRTEASSNLLDWTTPRSLDFEEPDRERFPALALASEVIGAGGGVGGGAVLNGANEAAVEAFLAGRIRFGQIVELTAEALATVQTRPLTCLGDALEADRQARAFVQTRLS